MRTRAPWTAQGQQVVTDVRDHCWGDLAPPHTRQRWHACVGRLAIEARDRSLGVRASERSPARADARHGMDERDAARTRRTTPGIARGWVEVRRQTRPRVCVVNVQRVERILAAICNRFQ